MNDKKLKILYTILFIIGLLSFIFHIFIFEKPDGNLGLILCIIETQFIIISAIRLCQLSKSFQEGFWKFLKLIFRF